MKIHPTNYDKSDAILGVNFTIDEHKKNTF